MQIFEHFTRWLLVGVGLALATLALGCGASDPNVGEVSGKVTLDGQPLANARLTFTPKVGGSPSFGLTDEEGEYVLDYSRDLQGAFKGDHTVTISTYAPGDPQAEPPVSAFEERVPVKYNLQTTLTAQVKPGESQTFDFALDSQGEVLSPEKAAAKRLPSNISWR